MPSAVRFQFQGSLCIYSTNFLLLAVSERICYLLSKLDENLWLLCLLHQDQYGFPHSYFQVHKDDEHAEILLLMH